MMLAEAMRMAMHSLGNTTPLCSGAWAVSLFRNSFAIGHLGGKKSLEANKAWSPPGNEGQKEGTIRAEEK